MDSWEGIGRIANGIPLEFGIYVASSGKKTHFRINGNCLQFSRDIGSRVKASIRVALKSSSVNFHASVPQSGQVIDELQMFEGN